MAFGDDDNDITMLKWAGTGVAMKNSQCPALLKLKQDGGFTDIVSGKLTLTLTLALTLTLIGGCADIVSGKAEDSGVAQILAKALAVNVKTRSKIKTKGQQGWSSTKEKVILGAQIEEIAKQAENNKVQNKHDNAIKDLRAQQEMFEKRRNDMSIPPASQPPVSTSPLSRTSSLPSAAPLESKEEIRPPRSPKKSSPVKKVPDFNSPGAMSDKKKASEALKAEI